MLPIIDSPDLTKSVINTKNEEISVKNRVKSASAPQLDEARRDSSLIGVFSAIKLSNKWKSKLNSKKTDDEGKFIMSFILIMACFFNFDDLIH